MLKPSISQDFPHEWGSFVWTQRKRENEHEKYSQELVWLMLLHSAWLCSWLLRSSVVNTSSGASFLIHLLPFDHPRFKGRSLSSQYQQESPSLQTGKRKTPVFPKTLFLSVPDSYHLFAHGNLSLPLNKSSKKNDPFQTRETVTSACVPRPIRGTSHTSSARIRSSGESGGVTGCWRVLTSHPDEELRVQQESTPWAGKMLLDHSLDEARAPPGTLQRVLPAQASGT